MRRFLTASALAIALSAPALADPSPITVDHVWSRPAAAGRVGVVYFTAIATAPDRLLSIDSPVATRAELHESVSKNGVMEMRPVDGIPVAPGQPLTLKPGGYHVMLMGLKQPLTPGESIPIMLRFEHAGTISAMSTVAKAGAPMDDHAAMPMGR